MTKSGKEVADDNEGANSVECEDLLKRCDAAINTFCVTNKFRFLWYGSKGQYNKIIEIVFVSKEGEKIEDKVLDKVEDIGNKILNNKETFIKICNNRIERLQNLSSEIVPTLATAATVLIGIGAVLTLFNKIPAELLSFLNNNSNYLNAYAIWCLVTILLVFILLLIISLTILLHRSNTNAWYAVKEGALRMKANKKDERCEQSLSDFPQCMHQGVK
jgi:ABC-type multidrug transport system fused ATPase/permease subunit